MSTPHKTHNPGFLALVWDAKSRIKEVNIEAYRHMPPEDLVLVDVREDNEWAAGHAAGAIHLGKGIIERDIETEIPDKSTTLVLYWAEAALPLRAGRRRVTERWDTPKPFHSTEAEGLRRSRPASREASVVLRA